MRDRRSGILVIQSLGLGDLLFALPAVRVLHRVFPGEPIAFLTHAAYADLLSLVPEIRDTLTYQTKNPLELIQLILAARRRLFRMVVVLNPIFRGSILAWLSGAPVRVGYLRDYEGRQSLWGLGRFLLTHRILPRDEKIHEVERYLDLLKAMGWTPQGGERAPRLILSESARQFGLSAVQGFKNGSGPVVAIHPGAGWALRCWPEERFAQLADWLVKRYQARIIFVGSCAEGKRVDRIREFMHRPATSLVGKTSLTQLVGLLSQCDLFIGNDAGPLHIAATLEIPSIALFGPGDPVKVRPLSRNGNVLILHHPVPWGPCRVQYTNRCQNNLCMKEISIEEVQEAVGKILDKKGTGYFFRKRDRHPPPDLWRNPVSGSQSLEASPPAKKILLLQSTSEISGTDITLLRTLEVLDKSRFEPHVVLLQEGPFGEEFRRIGCRVHLVAAMRKLTSRKGVGYLLGLLFNYPFAVLQIARLARREKVDLIHTNTIHNLYGFLAAKLARVPHLWHVREIVVQSPYLWRLERFLVQRFSDRFVVMNHAIGQGFMRRGGGFPPHLVKLTDGVDLGRFHPGVSGRRIRQELQIPEEVPLVGYIGRLDPWKGLEKFLETAAIILRQAHPVRFIVCGGEIEGRRGYEEFLKAKTRDLGIEESVTFTGWRYRYRDIPEVLRALNVLLHLPVSPEPYGLVVLEAMACGIPVVTVNQGGPLESCVDGETGLLVPPSDTEETAKAVLLLLKNPEKAHAMGMAGHLRAKKRFDRRRCVEELQALYEEILR